MRNRYYVGSLARLYGKGALVRYHSKGWIKAQFNDTELIEGFGWHVFRNSDFVSAG